jgi:hypothetical protein
MLFHGRSFIWMIALSGPEDVGADLWRRWGVDAIAVAR